MDNRPYPEQYQTTEWDILGRAVWFCLGTTVGGILAVAIIYRIGL
jgi:hypothetical protein